MALHHIRWSELDFVPLEGTKGPGNAMISRAIGTEHSETIGGGLLKLNQCSFDWKVRYDEVVYVLHGEIEMISEDEVKVGRQGDIFFLANGTPITYKTDNEAVVFYTLYPVNWK